MFDWILNMLDYLFVIHVIWDRMVVVSDWMLNDLDITLAIQMHLGWEIIHV